MFEFVKSELSNLALVRLASLRSVSEKSDLCAFTEVRFDPSNMAPFSDASEIFASDRSISETVAPSIEAPLRSAPLRPVFVFEKLALSRVAPGAVNSVIGLMVMFAPGRSESVNFGLVKVAEVHVV